MIARLTGSVWVRGLLTAGVLAVLATRIDLPASGEAMLRLSPRAAALVLLLLALDRAVMIWRWFSLVRAIGTPLTLRSAAWIYLVSSFAGSVSAVAGDAARALTLSRRNTAAGAAVASVGVDRLLGLLSILLVGMVGLLAGGPGAGNPQKTIAAAAVLAAGCTALIFTADRWVRRALPAGWHVSQTGRRVLQLADAFAHYRGHGRTLAGVMALSIVVQGLRILQAYLLGRGIGIDVELSYYLFFMPAGLIALMLPISVGGFGAPQGLIIWLLVPRGVPETDAFALSTLIVLTGILANVPGALLYLGRRRPSAS